jgi:type I restriction enzyme S subunit
LENYGSGHIEWIKTDNIERDNIYLTKATEYLSELGLKSGRSVEKGAVLVACIAGSLSSIGRCAIADRKVAFNQQINAIQPFESVSSVFLYWLMTLSSPIIQGVASKGMKKIITKSQFERIELISPDHDEQKQFENLATKLEATKLLLKQSVNEIETLFQSLLQKAFHGDLTFDIDLQLDAFLANEDFAAIAKDDVFIQRLIDRFNQHNQQNGEIAGDEKPFKFSSLGDYENAKKILFNLMKENKVGQVYDKEAKKTTIEML